MSLFNLLSPLTVVFLLFLSLCSSRPKSLFLCFALCLSTIDPVLYSTSLRGTFLRKGINLISRGPRLRIDRFLKINRIHLPSWKQSHCVTETIDIRRSLVTTEAISLLLHLHSS